MGYKVIGMDLGGKERVVETIMELDPETGKYSILKVEDLTPKDDE